MSIVIDCLREMPLYVPEWINSFFHASSVPWMEPNGRWEHPCGRGDRGLYGHLHLHALQHPGFYGMVPSCSPGAKGATASRVDSPLIVSAKFVSLVWFVATLNRTLPNSQWFLVGSIGRKLGESWQSPVRQRETPFPI